MAVVMNHIGETNKALNGQMMTIVVWLGFSNIGIRFEDGTEVSGKRYDHFKKGYIINPNCPTKTHSPKDRVGQTNKASNGLMMTIEVYRNATDIDVRFENGVLVQHKAYKEFLTGTIGCPGYGRFTDTLSRYIGKQITASNGQLMEVVAGDNHDDLTVRFEDGTEVQHVRSSSFFKGSVVNPNFTHKDILKERFVGLTNIAKNGLKMTIVDFRGYNDIDIMFEDGVKVCHKNMQHFRSGDIKHPNIKLGIKTDRIGETILSLCGVHMTVTGYPKSGDITVMFETGYITEHKKYHNFNKGKVGHPFPYNVGNVTMKKLAYIHQGTGNFYCHCNKCGIEDIMTVEEMREHICQNS